MANALYYEGPLVEESVSAVTATPTVELGTRRIEAGISYIYVYNASSDEQIIPTRGAKLASGSTGYSVDVAVAVAATFSASVLCGVCVNATLTTGTYGWLATRGFMSIENDGKTSIATGESIWLSTSGTFSRYTAPTSISHYGFFGICGVACSDQATTTTGTLTAYINSPWFGF